MRIGFRKVAGLGTTIVLLSALLFAQVPVSFAAGGSDPGQPATSLASVQSAPAITAAATPSAKADRRSPATKFLAWFVLGQEISASEAPATATLNLSAGQDVASFSVQLKAKGNVEVAGSKTLTLPGAPSQTPVAVPISYSVKGEGEGEGTIEAVVTALDPAGKTLDMAEAEVAVLSVDNEVLHANYGVEALKFKSLERRHKSGKISDEEYRNKTKELVRRGPAPKPADTLSTSAITITSTSVTMYGTLQWTDFRGGTHPIPWVTVQIMDDDALTDEWITTVTTNQQGYFTATFPNKTDVLEGGLDLFVRIETQGDAGWVERPLNDLTGLYVFESTPLSNVGDGTTWVFDYTFGNAQHSERAYGVYAAVATAGEYMNRKMVPWDHRIEVNYPTAGFGTVYEWGLNDLELGIADWSDWDVIQHEFGHWVADVIGIDDTMCTPVTDGEVRCRHTGYDNMIQIYGGNKNKGTSMPWAEAWPTYFALAVQREMSVPTSIPGAGNTTYDDHNPTDGTLLCSDTVETQDIYNTVTRSKGEDQEMAIMRVLWDLYDADNDAGDQGVKFDDGYLMELFWTRNSNRFTQAYQHLTTNGMNYRVQLDIGAIVTEHKIAPRPLSPSSYGYVNEGAPPSFSWEPGGSDYLNSNQFTVVFFNDALSSIILESETVYTPSWKPSASQWATIWNNSGSTKIKWAVRGTQNSTPVTGPYLSQLMEAPKNRVTGLTISPKPLTISNVGIGAKLDAKATFLYGASEDVSSNTAWSSDDPAVVEVSGTGYVTARSTGTTNVRAQYKGFTDAVAVTVTCPAMGSSFECATVINGPASGSVSPGGNVYYKMKVNAGQAYLVTMTMSGGDSDIYVHNNARVKVGMSDNGGTISERITFVPTVSGYYYFRVEGYEGTSSYSVNVTTTTCTTGSSVDCPINISPGGSASGSVPAKDVTYLRFYANGGMTYTITGRPTSGDPDIFLYNPYLDLITSSEEGSSIRDQIFFTATYTGYHYIQMYGYVPSSFTVSLANGNTGCEMGKDTTCAIPLSGTDSSYVDQGWSLYYKFYASANTSYSIWLSPGSGDPDLYIYDQSNTQVGASTYSSGTDRVNLNVSSAGWYYVRVYGYSTATFTVGR